MGFNSSTIINHNAITPTLRAFFVGFDLGRYRNEEFAQVVLDTLVDFAFGFHTGILEKYDRRILIEAAKSIYKIKEYSEAKEVYLDNDSILFDCEITPEQKYLKRGEFGEMILHLILRDFFETVPLLSKIHFKDTDGATVHGFDVVHIGPDLIDNEKDSIYLGESKLYARKDGSGGTHGINDLIDDIKNHFKSDFLYREIALIAKKKDAFRSIDGYEDKNTLERYSEFLKKKKKWYDILEQVTAKKLKLQDFFKSVTIPLVCTFESKIFDGCIDESAQTFSDALLKEVNALNEVFQKKLENHKKQENSIKTELNIALILFPIPSKKELVKMLHNKLQHHQEL